MTIPEEDEEKSAMRSHTVAADIKRAETNPLFDFERHNSAIQMLLSSGHNAKKGKAVNTTDM